MASTLEQLRDSAKELSDMTDSEFVADDVWNKWVRFGVTTVHRAVCNFFAATYFKNQAFTLAAGEYIYPLPDDFLRVKGVSSDPGTARRLTIRPFNFGERDAMPDTYGDGYCRTRRYAVIGSNLLQIQPMESAQGDYSVYYVPKPAVLTLDADELDDELEPWAEYVALEAAVKALVKEESFEQADALRAQIKIIRDDMAASNTLESLKNAVTNDAIVAVTLTTAETRVFHGLDSPPRTVEVVGLNAPQVVYETTTSNPHRDRFLRYCK